MVAPLVFQLRDFLGGHPAEFGAPVAQRHQPRSRIARIGLTDHVAGPLELVDQCAGGLFGHPCLLGEIGEPGSLGLNRCSSRDCATVTSVTPALASAAITRLSASRWAMNINTAVPGCSVMVVDFSTRT